MATSSPFGAAAVPALNPITAQIPNYALQSMQAQRQQAMAQALMEQGMAPVDYDNRGRISWTQGLAKMLSAYQGAKLGTSAMQQQAALQQQGMQAMGQAYGLGGQPDPQAIAAALQPQANAQRALAEGAQRGSVGPTTANAARMDAMAPPLPPQAPQQDPNMGGTQTPLNPYGAPPLLAYQASNGDAGAMEQLKTFLANKTQTPEIKNNNWSGITPEQAKAMALAKAVKESKMDFKPGEFTSNAFTGQNGFYPSIPPNSQPTSPVGPNGFVGGVAPVSGAMGVLGGNAGAEQFGRSGATIGEAVTPSGAPIKGYNKDIFGGSVIPPAVQAARDGDALAILKQERAKPGNSASDNMALDREIARAQGATHVVAGPDPTVQSGRTDQQSDMGKRWTTLASRAGAAQNVNSYLDQISSLADKASTGQFADRLQLTNSLLAPFSQKATDEVTARNLLDKYSSQIVAQLGSGEGMATDAARGILQSAYPNAKMNAPAIHEAVGALKAQNVMAQAKARVLMPTYSQNDPVAYTRAETAFDQAADPRIFQWRSIQDPAARKAFGAKIMAQDPSLAAKAKALEAMGVQ